MGNMVDYVRTEMRTFAHKPFGAVDSLVLSELAYIRMPAAVPLFGSARSIATVPIWELLQAEHYPEMFCTGSQYDAGRHDLLVAVAESPRFRGLRVGEYAERFDEHTETQFAAVTFDLTDCDGIQPDADSVRTMLYVAFRGTDNSLVGWKEDFNMSVRCPVPSQSQAVEYYRSVDERASNPFAAHPARIAVGGHSKGGNLAVYTAMKTQSDHISRIFSHDGPGFMREVTRSHAFHAIEPRVEKTVPESSVIGMLMSTVSRYTIVETNVSGIMQHMGLNWRIENGEFVTKPELTPRLTPARPHPGRMDGTIHRSGTRLRGRPMLRHHRLRRVPVIRRTHRPYGRGPADHCASGQKNRRGDENTDPQHPQSIPHHGGKITIRRMADGRRERKRDGTNGNDERKATEK
ncbi:Mbeg1-like protein [Bifidobacterium merycicum]|nr:Mbeg1-like protein [Bifidobacterium merycicum]